MKNEDFEIKLLIKQNTQMAIRLQSYRRENQELKLKNQDLNCWVQNLSEVFSSISAAWKIMTDNQEALYTLMLKKTDSFSKQLVSKYIGHFKAFDEILINLGDKITNQGHSDSATIDAKSRLSSFVSNYQLFFFEFVDAFFRFNEDCISFTQEKLKDDNLHMQLRQIATQSVENRQKIKEFQQFMTKMNQNYQLYEAYNQHQLLTGIVVQKEKEIDQLKDKYQKQARRIAYMTDYCSENVNSIIQHEDNFQCFCGGAPLKYYSKTWEANIKNEGNGMTKKQSSKLLDESEELIKEKIKQFNDLELEKQLLIQRNAQVLAKSEKIKLQNKYSEDFVLQSPLYLHLRNQFKDLMDYTNELTHRMNRNYEYLNELEKSRIQEIQELKKKYEKSHPSSHRNAPSEHILNVDHSFLQKTKETFVLNCLQLKNTFVGVHKSLKEKEDQLNQNKDALKHLRKENEDMNRRISQLQEKQLKSTQLEFRHLKYNELQKQINELIKLSPNKEQIQPTMKNWQELVDYTKKRDKKIKAMEDIIKKKDKQIVQKQKIEEVLKNAVTETQTIYEKYKEKLDSFEKFMQTVEKDIQNLTEENYKLKIQSEQEKNILNIRLKSELDVKGRLEEKAKNVDRVEEEISAVKELSKSLENKIQEHQNSQKERRNELRLEIKEKERVIQQLQTLTTDKEKLIEKAIEDKEKKNLEISKLNVKIASKSEIDIIKMQLQEYKSKIMCRCGGERERQISLKTCSHLFCKKCIDDTTTYRNRKCPMCGIRFSKADVSEINWS